MNDPRDLNHLECHDEGATSHQVVTPDKAIKSDEVEKSGEVVKSDEAAINKEVPIIEEAAITDNVAIIEEAVKPNEAASTGGAAKPSENAGIGNERMEDRNMPEASASFQRSGSKGGILRATDGVFVKGTKPVGNSPRSRRKGYVGKNFRLPACRKNSHNHEVIRVNTRQNCMFCRFLRQRAKEDPTSNFADLFRNTPSGPEGKIRQTRFACSVCEVGGMRVALCKDFCFKHWHDV